MSACAAAANLTEPPKEFVGDIFKNVAITFIVLEVLFVGLRLLARSIAGTPPGLDDYFVPISLIFNLGVCGISIAMVTLGGVGHHTLWACIVQPSALIIYAKLQIPFTVLLFLAISFAKLAILSLYLRIFIHKPLRMATYATMALQVASLITNSITTGMACTPLAYLWEPEKRPGGHCIDINAFWIWCNFPQILTDVVILLLPLPTLWRLNLSNRDKIGVVAAFFMGSIGLVTSIVRFIFFFGVNSQTDGLYVAAHLGCVSIAESGVYLIAACLPVYRSLFRRAKDRSGGGTSNMPPFESRNTMDHQLGSISKQAKGFRRFDDDGYSYEVWTESQ